MTSETCDKCQASFILGEPHECEQRFLRLQLDAKCAEAARLREALEPIAKWYGFASRANPWMTTTTNPMEPSFDRVAEDWDLTLDDLRKAAAALTPDDGWLERRDAEIVVAISRDKTDAIAQIATLNVQLGTMIDRLAATEAERDGLACALKRQTEKNDKWQSTFEDIDEDDMQPSAHAELSNVYRLQNDGVAEDAADKILARIRREARAEALREAAKLEPPEDPPVAEPYIYAYERGRTETWEFFETELKRMAEEADHA